MTVSANKVCEVSHLTLNVINSIKQYSTGLAINQYSQMKYIQKILKGQSGIGGYIP
jgi:hypothetical protein